MKQLTTEAYKKIVLELLVKIHQICQENGLGYCLAYGTLLGAIRHNGFIPWDDDADILMMRSDYDKLRTIINSGQYGIKFIDYISDTDAIYPFGKICDLRTQLEEKNFMAMKDYGAFVDVFPLDFLPNDPNKRLQYCHRHRRTVILATHCVRTKFEKTNSLRLNLKRMVAFGFSRLFNYRKMIRKMQEEFLQFNRQPTRYVGVPWDRRAVFFPVEFFCEFDMHTFEGVQLQVPKKYHEILQIEYGDYMKLPPVEQQVNPHQFVCYIKDNEYKVK